MCQAMGRSITAVIFGGAGTRVAPAGEAAVMEGEITVGTVDNMVQSLLDAQNIMIVPGYGLAVAQAQFAVADIAKKLKAMGKNVRFGIHPGELPLWTGPDLFGSVVQRDNSFDFCVASLLFPMLQSRGECPGN